MKHTHTASSSSFSSSEVFRFTLEITSGVHAPWIAIELGQWGWVDVWKRASMLVLMLRSEPCCSLSCRGC
ncbi:hypothetical protein EDB19DRAFT_1859056 [Suillus lakei]|nr:hypothetical protein EDB19DRAFT_1859056 [Suillus lakei]